jgi:hypothetical protein
VPSDEVVCLHIAPLPVRGRPKGNRGPGRRERLLSPPGISRLSSPTSTVADRKTADSAG